MSAKTAPRQRNHWRKIWLKFHLYIGLSVGLVFVLAGLTGSLLVYYVELDEFINPPLQITNKQAQHSQPTYEAIYQAIRAAHPERGTSWRLEMPRHAQAMLMARYYKPIEKDEHAFAPLIVWVNPYTTGVVSSRFWGEFLMTWLFDLHYGLLLDDTGETIMGGFGVVLLVALGTGVYLWWPSAQKWRQAFTIKRRASSQRFIFDLHKTNGIYSFVVLLLLVMSGVILEWPNVFKPMINQLSPLYVAAANQSEYKPGLTRISADKAVTIASGYFPTAQLRWLETPDGLTGSYKISFYQSGEPSKRFPKSIVWLDQYSGAKLAIRNPRQEQLGDIFINWLHPLHNGEIAGMPGRIIVFISGFIPLVLYITGLIRWLHKRQAKH